MKRNFSLQILTAAVAMVLSAGTAVAAQEKVNVTVVGSGGFLLAPVTPGTKGEATILVSVADMSGDPIQNLQMADLNMSVFATPPPAGSCGFTAIGMTQVKPGFYQVTVNMGNNCWWAAGDYIGTFRVFTQAVAGMAPFKLRVMNSIAAGQ